MGRGITGNIALESWWGDFVRVLEEKQFYQSRV